MNHETTIKRIKELVPSVMKLEFGSEVYCEQAMEGDDGNYHDFYGRFVRHLSIDECEVLVSSKTDISIQGKTELLIHYTISNLEIIGKPITLSVVLLALQEKHKAFVLVSLYGLFHKRVGVQQHIYLGKWDLTKDNFNDQSEETKTFIGVLIK